MKDMTNSIETKTNQVLNIKSQSKSTESKEEQKKFASSLINKKLKLAEKWYLINADWFNRWLNFIGLKLENNEEKIMQPNSYPAPDKINNKCLLKSPNQLKDELTEEIDYYTIPEELWNYLCRIYSTTQKEDVIERSVIDDNVDGESSLVIETRPLIVTISCSESSKKDELLTIVISRQTSLHKVVERIKEEFQVPKTLNRQMRLFFKSKDDKSLHPCTISNETLNNSGYGIQDIIYLEIQNENNMWPSQSVTPKPANTTAISKSSTQIPPAIQSASIVTNTNYQSNTRYASANFSNRHHEHRPGLCGLSNLGNTCFMNSSIQMMSNVPSLTEYFRSGDYKKEINKTNPLGRNGQLAEAYADLINEIWSGNNNYTMPRNFKLQIGRFAPQFTGFQQQDSHELLAFLLDGLHEDLNRIIKKPYVEMGSHVGKTDKQFADESWQDHLKRNDSIIVDLFHGLLKSTLNCLTCGEISIKFDPFCYLSLPLPSKKERLVEAFFVPLDLSMPITKLKLPVLKNGSISDLCSSLCNLLPNVQKTKLVVCDVYTNKFFKIYDPTDLVTLIRDRDDIYIYELSSKYNDNEFLKVKVHLKEKSTYQYSSTYFGLPLFMMVPKKDLTHGSLYNYILSQLKRYINTDSLATSETAANTSSEEINSKLSDSLNVKDEEYDEEVNREEPSEPNTAAKKLFNLVFGENDSIDNDNQQSKEITDSTPIDWQSILVGKENSYGLSQSSSSQNQILSLLADFGKNFNKRYYNKKPIEEYEEHASLNTQLVKKKDVLSLLDCFNLYTKMETLSENDYWYCSKCKSHEPSTKKFDLWSLPKVLVLQLKRFSYSRSFRDKIDTLVDFPLRELDLAEYLIHDNTEGVCTKYNLIAVSNHYGSLGGGHYTAYSQNRYDNKWYYFDDSSVSGADESSVCTHNAYLLTYIRQDSMPSSNGNLQMNTTQEKMDC